MRDLGEDTLMSSGWHVLFIYGIVSADHTAVYTYVCHTSPLWKSKLLVKSNFANVEGVWDFIFIDPNIAVISESFDHVRTKICILIESSFPLIFKQDFAPFIVRVMFSITFFLLISLINPVLFAFLNSLTIHSVGCIQY